jgi:predicted DNA binding CopG/RHH family protein
MKSVQFQLRRYKYINIEVTLGDFLALKRKALKKGVPYQTLASSILHQYATEQIKGEI